MQRRKKEFVAQDALSSVPPLRSVAALRTSVYRLESSVRRSRQCGFSAKSSRMRPGAATSFYLFENILRRFPAPLRTWRARRQQYCRLRGQRRLRRIAKSSHWPATISESPSFCVPGLGCPDECGVLVAAGALQRINARVACVPAAIEAHEAVSICLCYPREWFESETRLFLSESFRWHYRLSVNRR
jgi:hypothetical protein